MAEVKKKKKTKSKSGRKDMDNVSANRGLVPWGWVGRVLHDHVARKRKCYVSRCGPAFRDVVTLQLHKQLPLDIPLYRYVGHG